MNQLGSDLELLINISLEKVKTGRKLIDGLVEGGRRWAVGRGMT